jgi:tartrate dehydratase alpha subunit/fumarate hydratase class I-like protein
MTPENLEPQAGKARKRQAVKPSTRLVTKKVKSTIHLTAEASQRLDIHVAMMGPGIDRSSLIENLINTHLRRYVVSDRGGSSPEADEPSLAG